MVSSTVSDFLELHRAGKIRVIATSGEERTTDLPDVPTFKESGIDIVGSGWYGMFAPARTPPDVIARLNAALVAALAQPDLKARISGFGLKPTGTSPAQLAAIQKADADKWAPIVKASGFIADWKSVQSVRARLAGCERHAGGVHAVNSLQARRAMLGHGGMDASMLDERGRARADLCGFVRLLPPRHMRNEGHQLLPLRASPVISAGREILTSAAISLKSISRKSKPGRAIACPGAWRLRSVPRPDRRPTGSRTSALALP